MGIERDLFCVCACACACGLSVLHILISVIIGTFQHMFSNRSLILFNRRYRPCPSSLSSVAAVSDEEESTTTTTTTTQKKITTFKKNFQFNSEISECYY